MNCDQFEKALIERNYGQDGMYRTSDNGLIEFLKNLGKQK